MPLDPDLLLYDREGQLAATVEVRKKPGTSSEWAAQLRQYMLANSGVVQSEFFLVVTADRCYLWRNAGDDELVPPTYVIDMLPLFQPYLEHAGLALSQLDRQTFELVVMAWLGDLVRSETSTAGTGLVHESGLAEAARGGRLDFEMAA